ncbi:conserved membrane hypothetical protein [Candidatus Sulfopaludibacter sp. SbA3]|nr:conserved membrane hypothetical protein [Candidatus Sulfopaludibacter sp. SbA3]
MSVKTSNGSAGRLTYVLTSLLLLAPCYWQPRIQGGDLTSHMYNAWLTQWIETGGSEGLLMVRQTTNVLFELLLAGLFRVFNAEFAQRIAVSIAVLTFVWGAFAFVSVVAGRRPWHLLSCIAIFAYGWVFHMGFFSFYLSLGLCFWILALLWQPTRRRLAWAIPLGLMAYVAHVLPLLWTVGLVAYLWMARRTSERVRAYVTSASLLLMVAVHLWIGRSLFAAVSPRDMRIATGLDQVWLFDGKYYVVLVGLLLAWGLMFLEEMHSSGARRLVNGVPFQICIISAMGVVLLPVAVLIPGVNHALVYIAERMSLGVAICVCALLGSAQPRMQVRYALFLVALIFFGFLYGDERKRNSYEDSRQDTVAQMEVPAASHAASGAISRSNRTMFWR